MPNDNTLTLGICSRNVGSDPNPITGRFWQAAQLVVLVTTGEAVTAGQPLVVLEATGQYWKPIW